MGHKHSTLHRQLKQQDVPSHDLVTATDSGGGGGSGNNASPYFEVKQGPFRRKLSVRNISIRRSFHMSKKHTRLNKVSATTDDIKLNSNSNSSISAQASSSHAVPNGSVPTDLVSSSCGTGSQVPSTSTPTPVSLPRAASTNRNGDKYVMDRLRKSFRNSFRRKKDHIPESIKPHQWQSDEAAVKSGNCIFSVKYLGCVEVFESRGMQICEDALRRLRNSRRRPTKGTLYVTGDGLRVVDDETKGLIVDQTIEKVSFCAPDRSHERGFSYICRDGTTRRWMCHGFHATKDSGERLSHAVGCAFSVCLERKQRRDKEAVNSVFDVKTATFTRTGSFRQSSITERMQDPQVAKPTEPPPLKPVHNPYAVERPHAAASLLQRQGSLRGGPLNQVSPFKRQLSLRLGIDTLPTLLSTNVSNSSITNSSSTSSNQRERERAHSLDLTTSLENNNNTNTPAKRSVPNSLFPSKVTLTPSVAPIEEVSPSYDKASNSILTQPSQGTSPAMNPAESSIITAMCQELSQGLTMLAAKTEEDLHIENNDSFSSWSPGHFSPPAALDKWISTNNGYKKPPDVKPLVPPPVVDQMPQVTAPPPPSSPSYSTTFSSQFNTKMTVSSKPTDYHSSLFSDLTNTLKDNLSSSIKPTSSVSSSVQIVPAATSSTSTTFESISVLSKSTIPNINGSSTTNGGSHLFNSDKSTSNSIDPFDAGWAELSNRHLHDETKKSMTTFCNDATTTVTSSIPFKSTNPFLDLSQYETASTTSSGSANSVVASTQSTQPQQQMFKAFEVHM